VAGSLADRGGDSIKRIFTLMLAALAMVAVALLSAFIAMRLAIHGREAVVPALTGLSIDDATQYARSKGLRLSLENRFYSSDVPAGRILAQDPSPGARVRRDWPVRITESLGGQRVDIPDLTGQSERAAAISIRRSSLELGTVAHLPMPGDPDVVLAQTPPVNSAGADGLRLSLLVSDPPTEDTDQAYVMPALVGLTYFNAAERATAAGLHLILNPVAAPAPSASGDPNGQANSAAPATLVPSAPPAPSVTPTPSAASIVTAQSPPAGRRVVSGAAVHISINQAGASASPDPQ
jgi:beta-lactam-binding protein with PASTA domain